jgi:hypothetical protein
MFIISFGYVALSFEKFHVGAFASSTNGSNFEPVVHTRGEEITFPRYCRMPFHSPNTPSNVNIRDRSRQLAGIKNAKHRIIATVDGF